MVEAEVSLFVSFFIYKWKGQEEKESLKVLLAVSFFFAFFHFFVFYLFFSYNIKWYERETKGKRKIDTNNLPCGESSRGC